MPESQMNFGNMNFSGGIQNFGGQNTNVQNNYTAPAAQVAELLAAIRAEHPDPALAEREIAVIQGQIAEGTPEAKSRVEASLTRLAGTAGNARTVAEAVAAIGALVVAHWPF